MITKVWITLIVVCCSYAAGDMVMRVGNEIQASASGVDVIGATFLQRDIILTEGVVFAYSAYFRSNKPVSLQIWRPLANATEDDTAYQLLAQTRVIPSRVFSREDVYIESRLTESCIHVRQGDRLGVFFEDSPASISYVFDSTSPTALGNRLTDNATYTLGDVITFDTLVFPYDFSVAAYIDTDPSHYPALSPSQDFVSCYSGVLIPSYQDLDHLTTPPPTLPTGAPGATGARGPQGPTGEVGATGETGDTGLAGGTGATGPLGATGAEGPAGVDGQDGRDGTVGDTGPQGERGPKGDTVFISTNGSIIYQDSEEDDDLAFFSSSALSLGYLVWLAVLTLLFLLLLVITLVLCHRRRSPPSNDFGRARLPSRSDHSDDFDRPSFPPLTPQEKPPTPTSWMDTLKDQTETSYSNEALQNSPDAGGVTPVDNTGVPGFRYENETKLPEFMY